MSSAPPGMSTSGVEITNISLHGVWLLAGKRGTLPLLHKFSMVQGRYCGENSEREGIHSRSLLLVRVGR